jgi:predicted DCC family thiol-disulfide oxidoreductase YuxK
MDSKQIILFDGVCNFCNRIVNFVIRNDKKGRLKFAPLQSFPGQQLKNKFGIAPSEDTIVFIEKEKVYTYAIAAVRICRHLDWPAKLLYVLIIIPSFISQPVYKWFARHRYKWFGKKDTCMIPTPELKERFLD